MESGTQETKTLEIIAFVMKIFQASDEHKITTFFNRQVKNLQRSIKDAKQNITVLNNQIENLKTKEVDDIEDATANVKNAYSNINVDRLGSNAEMDNYSSDYWSNVKDAESDLKSLEKTYENKKKQIQEQIDVNNEAISTYENRIKTLAEFK